MVDRRPLILASGSERRQTLFKTLGRPFDVIVPAVDEHVNVSASPKENAMRLARAKALFVLKQNPDALVLGCDTIVAIGETMFGKPTDGDDAKRMLKMLSGATHTVVTGCALVSAKEEIVFHRQADVTFFSLDQADIDAYVETEEPFGKAGAYAIQGHGGSFVDTVTGDFLAIVGLPVGKIRDVLKKNMK